MFSLKDSDQGWFRRAPLRRRRGVPEAAEPAGAPPIEVHLPDGGCVILSFDLHDADGGRLEDDIVAALLAADGTEHDVAQAIRGRAVAVGLRAVLSLDSHPTIVVIRR